jgi:PleD family two-component response regulator
MSNKRMLSYYTIEWVLEEEEVTQLLEDADKALYKSKTNGRNRVDIFDV